MPNHLPLVVTGNTTIDTGQTENYAAITVLLGGNLTVSGAGTDVTTPLLVNSLGGSITVDNGAIFDIEGLGANALAGAFDIGSGGTLVEGVNVSALAPANFLSNTGMLALNMQDLLNLQIASPVTGFRFGDILQVNQPVTSATYSGDILTLHNGGNTVANIELTGIGLNAGFTVQSVGHGLFDIGVACFLPETLVLTDKGEVRAKEVAIGDRLITATGEAKPVKWIGRRRYSASMVASEPHVAPVVVRQGALADNLPRRDLHLSPCHALYLDGILIEAGQLVNGVSILRAPHIEDVEYINFEFEDHDIVVVEGVAAETGCSRGNGSVYDNADEYAVLYPNERRDLVKPYCAPRLDCGFEVEAVRRRIDARAGIFVPSETVAGELKGWIENLDDNGIRGVAATAGSDVPVVLQVAVNGTVLGEVIANHSRPARLHDLGAERCGFQFRLPEGLSPYRRHTISLRRVSDGAELPGSPFMLEAAVALDDAGRGNLASALHTAMAISGSVAEIDRALAFLAGRADALAQARADLAGHRAERTQRSFTPGWSRLRQAA